MYKLIEAEWRIYASLNWAIIGSDNGLSPVQREAIIWTNAEILLIGPSETNFSEIVIGIETFLFKKLYLKTSSAKRRLFCLGLNELMQMWCYGNIRIKQFLFEGFRCYNRYLNIKSIDKYFFGYVHGHSFVDNILWNIFQYGCAP